MPYITASLAGTVIDGSVIVEELRWKTVDTTHSLPGRFVTRDTTDSEIKLQSSGGTGTIGIVLVRADKDSTVAAVAAEWARIGHGPGVVVVAVYDKGSGNSVTKGDALYVGANGKTYKAAGTDPTKIVANAEETKTADGNIRVRLAI